MISLRKRIVQQDVWYCIMCRLRLWIPMLICCASFLCQIINFAVPYWGVLFNSFCGKVNFGIFKTESEFGRCTVRYSVVSGAILNTGSLAAAEYGLVILLGFMKQCTFKKNLKHLFYTAFNAFLAGILTLIYVILFGATEKYLNLPKGKGQVAVNNSRFHFSFYLSVLAAILIIVAGILFCVVDQKEKASQRTNSPPAVNGPVQRRRQVQKPASPQDITLSVKERSNEQSSHINNTSSVFWQPGKTPAINGPCNTRDVAQKQTHLQKVNLSLKRDSYRQPFYIEQALPRSSKNLLKYSAFKHQGNSPAINGPSQRRDVVQKRTCPKENNLPVIQKSQRQPSRIDNILPQL